MKPERVGEPGGDELPARYPLLDTPRNGRSRRFGMGMKIESRREPLPLTEEATLALAACDFTGYAWADLSNGRGQEGGWQEPHEKTAAIPAPTEAASEATIAYWLTCQQSCSWHSTSGV